MNEQERAKICKDVARRIRSGYIAQWEVRYDGRTERGYVAGTNPKGHIVGFYNVPWQGRHTNTNTNSGVDILFVDKVYGLDLPIKESEC